MEHAEGVLKRSATEFDKELGAQIRGVRIAAGLTQSDLARGVGLTFQQIQKYEQGSNRVSASMLLQLGKALNADFSALVAPQGASPAETILCSNELRLLDNFGKLDGKRQRIVLDLVNCMAEDLERSA